jgi:hypothetical protein
MTANSSCTPVFFTDATSFPDVMYRPQDQAVSPNFRLYVPIFCAIIEDLSDDATSVKVLAQPGVPAAS